MLNVNTHSIQIILSIIQSHCTKYVYTYAQSMHIDMTYVCRYDSGLASVYTCAEAEMSAQTLQCNSCSTAAIDTLVLKCT